MKVGYSKARLTLNLFLSVCWTIAGILNIRNSDSIFNWRFILYSILILSYWVIFLFQYLRKYFKINDYEIVLYGLRNKTINFNELVEIKFFADEYIFADKKQKIVIAKSLIDKEMLIKFEEKFLFVKSNFKQIKG